MMINFFKEKSIDKNVNILPFIKIISITLRILYLYNRYISRENEYLYWY